MPSRQAFHFAQHIHSHPHSWAVGQSPSNRICGYLMRCPPLLAISAVAGSREEHGAAARCTSLCSTMAKFSCSAVDQAMGGDGERRSLDQKTLYWAGAPS